MKPLFFLVLVALWLAGCGPSRPSEVVRPQGTTKASLPAGLPTGGDCCEVPQAPPPVTR